MTTIQADLTRGRQSLDYVRITNEDGKKVRVRIKRDFYDNQSYGSVDFWNGSKWERVIYRDISTLECVVARHGTSNFAAYEYLFINDADDMEQQARLVIA